MYLILSTFNQVPDFGRSFTINKAILRPAGESLNAAFPLAKLNIPVSVISMIGNDYFGKIILKDILNYSIDIKGLKKINNEKTGISICLINKKGDRSIIDYLGVKSKIDKDLIYRNIAIIEKSGYIYIGGYYLHPGIGFKGYLDILKNMKKMGKIIFFDTGWDPNNFNNKSINEILKILEYIDVFLPNYEEGKAISNKKDPIEIIDFFKNEGIKNIFLKLGSKGCAGFYKDEIKFQDTFPVKVKDTAGAGDAFNAGVIFGFINEYDLDKILIFSNALSSLVVSRDENRFPTFEEVKGFLNTIFLKNPSLKG